MAWHRFQGEATSYLLTDNRSNPFNSSMALPLMSSVWITGWMKRKQNKNQETAQLLRVLGIRGWQFLGNEGLLAILHLDVWGSLILRETLPFKKQAAACRPQHKQTAATFPSLSGQEPLISCPQPPWFSLLENDFIHEAQICPLQSLSAPWDPVNNPQEFQHKVDSRKIQGTGTTLWVAAHTWIY